MRTPTLLMLLIALAAPLVAQRAAAPVGPDYGWSRTNKRLAVAAVSVGVLDCVQTAAAVGHDRARDWNPLVNAFSGNPGMVAWVCGCGLLFELGLGADLPSDRARSLWFGAWLAINAADAIHNRQIGIHIPF